MRVIPLLLLISAAAAAQTLQNTHFATPYTNYDGNTSVAQSWSYFEEHMNPKFQQSTFEQMPGGPGGQVSCQQIWADWSAYRAGIYQRVSGCTIAQPYKLTGWCLSIYQHGVTPTPPQGNNIGQKLGIDPYGGTDPLSTNVRWCTEDWTDRTWRELQVTATAQSTTITVFARSNNVWAKTNCLTFYDAFGLTAVANALGIANVQVKNVSYNRATIEWVTNATSTSRVDYGPTTSYGQSVEDSALVTNHSVTITGLNKGATYHLKCTSTKSGYTSASSDDATLTTMGGTLVASVQAAKDLADGTKVIIPDVSVTATTAQLSDKLYVCEPDRSSGIRVAKTANTGAANVGDRVDVNGTLATTNGERYLSGATMAMLNPGQPALVALGMVNRAVGGSAVNNGVGLYNIGLLVRIWGRATKVDTGAKCFYVDDGAGLLDGSAYKGVRVYYSHLTSFTPPVESHYAVVTAIASTTTISAKVVPQLLLREQGDLVGF